MQLKKKEELRTNSVEITGIQKTMTKLESGQIAKINLGINLKSENND